MITPWYWGISQRHIGSENSFSPELSKHFITNNKWEECCLLISSQLLCKQTASSSNLLIQNYLLPTQINACLSIYMEYPLQKDSKYVLWGKDKRTANSNCAISWVFLPTIFSQILLLLVIATVGERGNRQESLVFFMLCCLDLVRMLDFVILLPLIVL